MMGRPKTRWMFLLSLILVLTAFYMVRGRDAQVLQIGWGPRRASIATTPGWITTPQRGHVTSGEVSSDYPSSEPVPPTGDSVVHHTRRVDGFDSQHPCLQPYDDGRSPLRGVSRERPGPLRSRSHPGSHPGYKSLYRVPYPAHGFDTKAFLKTAHANPNNKPRKFFDQPSFGVNPGEDHRKIPGIKRSGGNAAFHAGDLRPDGRRCVKECPNRGVQHVPPSTPCSILSSVRKLPRATCRLSRKSLRGLP